MPHLQLLKLSHRVRLTVPVTVFLAEMSLTVQSFSSLRTTKSLDRTRPLFSPFGQSVISPFSYRATRTSAPLLSTFVLRAPVMETRKVSGEGLWKVACSKKIVIRQCIKKKGLYFSLEVHFHLLRNKKNRGFPHTQLSTGKKKKERFLVNLIERILAHV